ncbi:SIMPL domain-containing protein [Ornithinimicrobium panacihumi]|uniref:SIMPL domain-containing protein n=1 Tax=Ornithinimicrobium panacihumi TaxID=2008449 RepID=UPI003F8C949B
MNSTDTVVVLGRGTAAAAPDTLVLDLQLEGHGATVAEALDALTSASGAAHQALPEMSVRTHGLGLHPRHDNHGRQVGHTAYQQLQVRSPGPNDAGEVVRRLSEVVGNALGVNGLRPELADTVELTAQARDRAFADAQARAEQHARLAGRRLGAVRQVREGDAGSPRPMATADARVAAFSSPTVEAADHQVVVSVEVTWDLVD